MVDVLIMGIAFLLSFVAGYAVRSLVSYNRRINHLLRS
jgi:hypothetical protein